MASGIPGSARHGTMSAYNKHLKDGEEPCGPCRQYGKEWARARYVRAKSGYRLSMGEAFAQLGLPADRTADAGLYVPGGAS